MFDCRSDQLAKRFALLFSAELWRASLGLASGRLDSQCLRINVKAAAHEEAEVNAEAGRTGSA